jgi:outer membrane receptor for monomeric catechols
MQNYLHGGMSSYLMYLGTCMHTERSQHVLLCVGEADRQNPSRSIDRSEAAMLRDNWAQTQLALRKATDVLLVTYCTGLEFSDKQQQAQLLQESSQVVHPAPAHARHNRWAEATFRSNGVKQQDRTATTAISTQVVLSPRTACCAMLRTGTRPLQA